jgi:hypothetical protein
MMTDRATSAQRLFDKASVCSPSSEIETNLYEAGQPPFRLVGRINGVLNGYVDDRRVECTPLPSRPRCRERKLFILPL